MEEIVYNPDGTYYTRERAVDETLLKSIESSKIQREIIELEARLNQLTQDIIQIQCGADFGTRIDEEGNEISIADERVAEFREKHNRLRYLKGKEPREYK